MLHFALRWTAISFAACAVSAAWHHVVYAQAVDWVVLDDDDDHAHEEEHHDDIARFGHAHPADEYEYDHIEFGRTHRHETAEGLPFMHLLNTEHAFLDHKIQVVYAFADGADAGEVNEHELEFEFFHVLNSRLGVLVEVPIIGLDPLNDPNTAGIGDVEFGLQWIGFNGHYDILAFGLNVAVPTGDEDRDLGDGHSVLEAVGYYLHDFGGGTLFQSELKFEMPVSTEEVENEFVYNMGIGKTLLGTQCWRRFRYLTPLIELNGITAINGDESGATIINLTPGLRWIVGEHDQAGIGFSFPVTGDEEFRSQFIIDYIRHF